VEDKDSINSNREESVMSKKFTVNMVERIEGSVEVSADSREDARQKVLNLLIPGGVERVKNSVEFNMRDLKRRVTRVVREDASA